MYKLSKATLKNILGPIYLNGANTQDPYTTITQTGYRHAANHTHHSRQKRKLLAPVRETEDEAPRAQGTEDGTIPCASLIFLRGVKKLALHERRDLFLVKGNRRWAST